MDSWFRDRIFGTFMNLFMRLMKNVFGDFFQKTHKIKKENLNWGQKLEKRVFSDHQTKSYEIFHACLILLQSVLLVDVKRSPTKRIDH